MKLNYEKTDEGFTGEMPDGTITHDEDEFYDAWAHENEDLSYENVEDWT